MNISISDRLKTLIPEIDESLKNFDKEKLETSELPLNQLREDLRETIQEHLREPVKRLIKRLKKDEDLSSEDLLLIEKWIVGDAEYYAKIENNLNDWVAECKRLCNVLSTYTSVMGGNELKMFEVGALLTDLKYTLTDVIRYSEAMNRIDRFKSSIGAGTLTRETKKWLADTMQRQLASDEF